jgi:hypothetical protein
MADTSAAGVAVIVVHGVADQARGTTAAAVAAQLAAPGDARVDRTDVLVDTPAVPATREYFRRHDDTFGQRVLKSFWHSVRSDFLETDEMKHAAVRAAHGEGVLYTDYLIAKARTAHATGPCVYEAPCFRVRADDSPALDVFEMYWADRSRLTGFVARIATEIFTLLFHLSRLATDALAMASHLDAGNRSLRWTAIAQRVGDWMFSRVLALLSVQLVVCVLLLLPRALLETRPWAGIVALVVLGLLLACVLVYRGSRWLAAVLVGAAAVAGTGWWIGWSTDSGPAALLFNAVWAAVLLAAHEWFLRYAEERFKAVLGVGRVLFAVTLGLVVAGMWREGGTWGGWATGALMAVEAVLLGYAIAWSIFACAIWVSAVASVWSGRGVEAADAARIRQSVVTGQLGLYLSMSAFLAVVMTLWAIVEKQLEMLVDGLSYRPWHFTKPYAGACRGSTSAYCFIEDRFTNSTEHFALLVPTVLMLAGFITLVMLPSVMVELRLVTGLAKERLGGWLTSGFRAIEKLVRWWSALCALLALFGAAVLLASLLWRLGVYDAEWLQHSASQDASQKVLSLLVYALTGGAVGLVALGSVAIKQIRALRAPLDAALDVDKHFREFPRKAIPRVEIIERYIGLLRHVCERYRRIVIVSHSQGTVVTTELLCYLRRRAALLQGAARDEDAVAVLATRLSTMDVRLLTAGCPLRQLYALRFPFMYDWVLGEHGPSVGPSPADLGLRAWTNVWGAGDYVGRWLWSSVPKEYPLSLQLPPSAYEAPAAGATPPRVRDVPVGADAHTHYFDLDQKTVVSELASLLGLPPLEGLQPSDAAAG